MVTFNCKNVKRSVDTIRDLMKTADIIALQETWLLPEELSYLNTISDDFSYTGESAVDTSQGILRGRPYGGVALLWRRKLFPNVSVIQCGNPRICAVKIILKEKAILVVSVYMPTDSAANLAEFTDIMSSVSAILDNCSVDCAYILGDFNAHPFEQFYDELTSFCSDMEWSCVDIEMLNPFSDTYTFVSDAGGARRWLDHCVVTAAAAHSIKYVYVKYDIMWSDHYPLVIKCELDIVPIKTAQSNKLLNKVVWGDRSPQQIERYRQECHRQLRLVDIPHELLGCCDKRCTDLNHRNIVDAFYKNIVTILSESAVASSLVGKSKKRVIPGWNKYVSDAHREAKLKLTQWMAHGKPLSGDSYREMCDARRIFKSRLKWCQNHADQIKMDILASHHKRNNFRSFWKHTNKFQPKPGVPVSIGGLTNHEQIANLFVDHFSVQSPLGTTDYVLDAGNGVDRRMVIRTSNIRNIIKSMKRGKSPGHDGLSIEHLQYAGPHLSRILCLLFNFCLSHSYMPGDMMRTIVVPVVKCKTSDISDKNNYRPISLATVTSKIFDSVLNSHLNSCVKQHDNQFGFKKELSTESAVLCLKSTVSYYAKRGTSVIACFLDLSRAFDLVSYNILWKKLHSYGIPEELINTLKYWYGNQINSVRWQGALSRSYGLECGVRQGGLTSPTLFNIYVEDLIHELSGTKVGCHVDGICVNNMSYADDMVLLSASVCGIRKMLAICETYARLHGLIYNVKKSKIMVFGAGSKCLSNIPSVSINNCKLERVYKFKYLGHYLTPDLKDDCDIQRERRSLSIRANMLARRFARSSYNVKITLFRAYCTSLYTCSLWADYTQKAYNALRVQFNNSFRVLLGLPWRCSASGMFAEARVDCFYATMRKRCASLVHRVRGSTNSILNMFANRLDCPYVNHCGAVSHGIMI